MEICIEKECILIYGFNTDTINYLYELKKDFEMLNIVVYESSIYLQTEKSEMYRLLYTITNDLCEYIERIEWHMSEDTKQSILIILFGLYFTFALFLCNQFGIYWKRGKKTWHIMIF